MKKLAIIVLFMAIYMPLFAQLGYWYKSDFIELSEKKDSVYYLNFRNKSASIKQLILEKNEYIKVLSQFNDYEFLIKKTGCFDLKECYISPKYEAKVNGGEMVILPQIVMSIKNNEVLSSILSKYKNIVSVSYNFRSIYEFDCELLSSDEVLRLSMEISQIDGVNWCEPNKMLNIVPFNTFYPNQFYLNNPYGEDINVESAWSITTGEPNITVAVIDCGVDRNHEDLSANIINGYTVDHPESLGSPLTISQGHSHGTACAGIVGAINNSIGIRGVASGIKILPVNISTGGSDFHGNPIIAAENKVANAIRWAVNNGADVLSCSWGASNYSANIDSAIVYAITEGRNMKGVVVVCASGNYHSTSNPVSFPARMDDVIAVGAIDRDGEICDYSQRGSTLNLVAPSNKILQTGEIYTTMISGTGNIGNENNYTDSFGGTSAACPQVAGVAALMLSLRPDLTESEVRNILYSTAHDLGATGKDDTFGYGLVDAYAALKVVNSSISGKTVLCDTANYVINGLPSNYTINWSINNSNFSISPSGNQCLVTYTGTPQYSVANLTATVSWSGTTIKTLTKRIVMHGTDLLVDGWQIGTYSPNGTYPDVEFTIPNNRTSPSRAKLERLLEEDLADKESLPIEFTRDLTNIHPGTPPVDSCGYGFTEIYGGNMVYLNSDHFDSMNISFSGPVSPTYFYRNDNNGSVIFNLPYQNSVYYTTLHARADDHCHDFCLSFKVQTLPGAASGDDEICVDYTGSMLYITFMGSIGTPMPNYSVTITKIPAGTIMYSNTFPGYENYFSVNTSSWTSGIYSIRIVQNGHIYNKTFCI